MLQLLPQKGILTPSSETCEETIEFINNYIDKYHCETMDVDISYMNVIDACYVSALCAAKHYVKYPDGKISWKVSSQMVDEFTGSLNLGNNTFYE